MHVPTNFATSARKNTRNTLFVAGDFPRFAVLSVTAWPIQQLLDAEAEASNLPGVPPTDQKQLQQDASCRLSVLDALSL